ncbi:MAG TPA: Rieske (2Fe-2S) protein [Solirubrobacteraceae bacterium]|nr:Rieske (2Fe-2S) protein [Solirubrobacteraceae bacterium]
MAELFVAPRELLEQGVRLLLEADGSEVGVLAHDGKLFAYENRCVHQGGPVCEGLILGAAERVLDETGADLGGRLDERRPRLICPWHGWEFDLATGRSVAYPQLGLRRFELEDRDGDVYLRL